MLRHVSKYFPGPNVSYSLNIYFERNEHIFTDSISEIYLPLSISIAVHLVQGPSFARATAFINR